MDTDQFAKDVLPVLSSCQGILAQLRECEPFAGTNIVTLIETAGLFDPLVYAFHKVIRKLPKDQGLTIVLSSFGGSIDAAASIASLAKERFGSFRVAVPFMAKSAATLLALAADRRAFACSAQLGPVDPQVRHPEKGMWFAAHSIKQAIDRVEQTQDQIVKMSMAEKLDPFLLGAYGDAMSMSKQYIEEVVNGWTAANKPAIVTAFNERYISHGYPIDRRILKDLGVSFEAIDGDCEELVLDLHERCFDLLDGADDEGAIILTEKEYLFRSSDFRQSGPLPSARSEGPPAAR